ncbi:MAG: hypothetical protein IJY62_03455 [Clostridia bacterium]|nr:hypothetical protein [Clostridia bacterium]
MRSFLKRAVGVTLGLAFLLTGTGCGNKEKNPWDDKIPDGGDGGETTVVETQKVAEKVQDQLSKANGASLSFGMTFTKGEGESAESKAVNASISLYKDENGYDVKIGAETTEFGETEKTVHSAYFIDNTVYLYDAASQTYFIKAAQSEGVDKADSGAVIGRVLSVMFGAESEETVIISSVVGVMSADYASFADGKNQETLIATVKSVLDTDGVKTETAVEVTSKDVIKGTTEFDVSSRYTPDTGLVYMNAGVSGVWSFGEGEGAYSLTGEGDIKLENIRADAAAIALPNDAMVVYELWNETFTPTFATGVSGSVVFSKREVEESEEIEYTAQVRTTTDGIERVYSLVAAATDVRPASLSMTVEKYIDGGIEADLNELATLFSEPITVAFDYENETADFTGLPAPTVEVKDFLQATFEGKFAANVTGMVEFTVKEEGETRTYSVEIEVTADGRKVTYKASMTSTEIKPVALVLNVTECKDNGVSLTALEMQTMFASPLTVALDYEEQTADFTGLAIPEKTEADVLEMQITVVKNTSKAINGGSGTFRMFKKNGVWNYELKQTVLQIGKDMVNYAMRGQATAKNQTELTLKVFECIDLSESRDTASVKGTDVTFTIDYQERTVAFSAIKIPPRLWSDFY